MKAMVSIGGEYAPGLFTDIAEGVCNILKTARENDMDQETTRAALQILPSITKVEHVAVTGSTFTTKPPKEKKSKKKKDTAAISMQADRPDSSFYRLGEDGS